MWFLGATALRDSYGTVQLPGPGLRRRPKMVRISRKPDQRRRRNNGRHRCLSPLLQSALLCYVHMCWYFMPFFGMFTVPDYHQSVMHRRPTYSRAPGPQQPAPAVPQSSWQPPTGRKTMADLFKQPPAPAAPLPTPAATHSVQESFSHKESAPISELVRLRSCLASPVITS